MKNKNFRKLKYVPGNPQNTGFCTIYPTASGGLGGPRPSGLIYFYFPAPVLSINCFSQYVQYNICSCSSQRSQGRSVVQWSLKDRDLFCSYWFLACDTSSGVLGGFFNFFPGIVPSCHFKSMLIYRNHKQLKTNTSHNNQSWRKLFFCLTLGQTGTGVLSDPWPLCLSHHFFVILYITCHIFFLYRTECKITYSHDH